MNPTGLAFTRLGHRLGRRLEGRQRRCPVGLQERHGLADPDRPTPGMRLGAEGQIGFKEDRGPAVGGAGRAPDVAFLNPAGQQHARERKAEGRLVLRSALVREHQGIAELTVPLGAAGRLIATEDRHGPIL